MNAQTLWQRGLIRCALILAFWTVLGLVDIAQLTYQLAAVGRPLIWWRIVSTGMIDWYLYAALTPVILWLAQRFPISGPSWIFRATGHLVLSIVTALLVITIFALDSAVHRRARGQALNVHRLLVAPVRLQAPPLHASLLGRRRHLAPGGLDPQGPGTRTPRSQLETRLAQAQLQVLKMQLHPHFLFNTLNAISALVHQNPDLADRMIARLGELLRLTLENADVQEVPLRRELAMINPYLEIQQSRLGDRLAINLDIAPDTMDAQVPNLMLQPLVENAIQRGIATRPGGGRLELKTHRIADRLQVVVRDEGKPVPNGHASDSEAVELSNTRTRLQQMYGAGHRFTFEADALGTHVLTLEIPFHQTTSPSRDDAHPVD